MEHCDIVCMYEKHFYRIVGVKRHLKNEVKKLYLFIIISENLGAIYSINN